MAVESRRMESSEVPGSSISRVTASRARRARFCAAELRATEGILAGTVQHIHRNAAAAERGQRARDGGIAPGPVGAHERDVLLRERRAHRRGSRTRRLFTWQVTHHAAVKSTNTGRPDDVSAPTLASVKGCHCEPAAARPMRDGAAASSAASPRNSGQTSDRRSGERDDARNAPRPRAAGAHDAPRPKREAEAQQREQQADHRVVVRLRPQHPHEPDHGRVERKCEQLLESHQPRTRARQAAAPGRKPRQHHVRHRHADAQRR